jgi:hypothetical protein
MKRTNIILSFLLISIYCFTQVNQYDQPASTNFRNTYVPIDFNALNRASSAMQARNDRNEQIKKEKLKNAIDQLKTYYNSLTTYPEKINDGWHKVISTNNYDLCVERKVYISNGKVSKYVIDDWAEKKISYSSVIYKAKSMVQLINDDGSNGDMVELYFIEDISNPNSYVSEPVSSGKVCFWSNMKRGGAISVYIEDTYIGEINQYFSKGSPNCGQSGTLAFEYKPGTYNFKATNSNLTWNGKITISAGNCSLQGLSK